jgi:nucleotide-binding universal stress UspA family protein
VASRVARASGARLRLLHVVADEGAGRWTVLRQVASADLEDQWSGVRQSQAERAYEALERVADELGGSPQATVEVVRGSVADQIAQVADTEGVDLVVLGLRGSPGVTGARVGAIAYRVLSMSPVPVLAVPHEAREHALAFVKA